MYRVGDEDDLVSIGYYDYLARDGFCLCEWSENIVEFIPNEAITVTISKTDGDEDERIIKIEEHTEK
jgi:tRNA threonylcarbamoyladenosine biosynthesis protein TsaE